MERLESAYRKSNVAMVGASLLIIYEGSDSLDKNATVNLIDFAHSRVLPEDKEEEFSHERQGVLLGLKNICKIINTLIT